MADLFVQGRTITSNDLDLIRRLMAENPSWTRTRLSKELCRLWDWRSPTDQLKDIAARTLLRKLEAMGQITLPSKRQLGGAELWSRAESRRLQHQPTLPLSVAAEFPITGSLAALQPLQLVLAEDAERLTRFKSLLQHYHYLGFKRSVGQNLKYLAFDRAGRELGCALFGSPAWRCADRDHFIGWSDPTRAARLVHITNNTRFLILPWVRVPHLASHLLGRIVRRIRADWQQKYAQPLWLLETFVDSDRFTGTCYRAANWIRVGRTQGRSRNDRERSLQVPTKAVFVYPLDARFRERLAQ